MPERQYQPRMWVEQRRDMRYCACSVLGCQVVEHSDSDDKRVRTAKRMCGVQTGQAVIAPRDFWMRMVGLSVGTKGGCWLDRGDTVALRRKPMGHPTCACANVQNR